MRGAEPSTWGAFAKRFALVFPHTGEGVRVLSRGRAARRVWRHRCRRSKKADPMRNGTDWSPLARDNVWAGAELAFGEAKETVFDFSRVDRVLSLDADLFATKPGALRAARQIAERRRDCRLYAVETAPRTFGAFADHRWALTPSGVVGLAHLLAQRFGLAAATGHEPAWFAALANDLEKHRGACAVVVGDEQPPIVHAIAHHLNATLGAPVSYTDASVAPYRRQRGIASLTCAEISIAAQFLR